MAALMDIRTLSFASAMVKTIIFAYMLHLWLTRKTYPGFGQWTLAAFLHLLGLTFLSLRGLAPDWLSIMSGNILIISNALLMARGLAAFAGQRPSLWPDILIMTVMVAAFGWFTYLQPNTNIRIIIFALVDAYYHIRSACLAGGPVTRLLGGRNWPLVATLAGLGAYFFLRALLTFLFEHHLPDFMAAGPWQATTFVVSFLAYILIPMGLVFLNIQRMELELATAQQEVKVLGGLLPICANCKSIRDDSGYWHQVEQYISAHSQAEFSHAICPQCLKTLYPELADRVLANLEAGGGQGAHAGQAGQG